MPAEPAVVPQGPFEGREAFRQAVRDALERAVAQAWPELVLCDPDFDDWPLGERAVAEALHAWAQRGQSLWMLAGRYDRVLQRHDRFVGFRRQWGHRIECRTARTGGATESVASLLWSPQWMIARLDRVRCTGWAGHDPVRGARALERFDEAWHQARPGFPVTVLGL